MRTGIEKSESVTKGEATELEYQHFPRILSRRSYLKVLSLGMMAMVGTAVSQSVFERFIKNSENFKQAGQVVSLEKIKKSIKKVFNRE